MSKVEDFENRVARYREEQIRENFGSREEFLEICEHDDAVRKLSEIVWEFNGFSTEVAKVNGVAIGHVALRGRPDYDDAYEVVLYNSAGEKDAVSGKAVSAAIAHVGPGQDKPRFLKMAEEALANGTPSDVFTVLRGKSPETNHLDILRIATAMDKVHWAERSTSIERAWWNDRDINDTVNAGVSAGYLRRPSTSQVEWSESGVNALKAAYADIGRSRDALATAEQGTGLTQAASRTETREELADASQVFDAIEKANEPLRQAGLPLYGELVAALAEVAKKVPFCTEQDTAARLVEQVQSAGGVQSAARTRMRP